MPNQRADLSVTVKVNASAEEVWAALVDWDRQGEWILGTRVKGTAQGGQGVGGVVEAWTGVGPIGFLDTMVITEWVPPKRCLVRHTGRVVRGTGAFEVEDAGEGRSRILWSEQLDLPLGAVGRVGWSVARPVSRYAITRSLRRLARAVETAWLPH